MLAIGINLLNKNDLVLSSFKSIVSVETVSYKVIGLKKWPFLFESELSLLEIQLPELFVHFVLEILCPLEKGVGTKQINLVFFITGDFLFSLMRSPQLKGFVFIMQVYA